MSGIFISYRREDAAGHAGRLYDRLRARFDNVFLDVSGIEAGVDFVDAIDAAVGACDLLIIVIGREWLRVADARGRRRLEDPNDFVRLEATTALERGIRVVPVLVEGAAMPPAEDLPEDMRALARRQAFELRDSRWNADVDELIAQIARVIETPAGTAASAPPQPAPPPPRPAEVPRAASVPPAPPLPREAPQPAPATATTSTGGSRSLAYALAAALVIVAAVVAWMASRPTTVAVPDVVGTTLDAARETLEAARLASGEVRKVQSDRPPGSVIEQSPPRGTEVEPGTRVALTIAEAPPRVEPSPNVEVPNLALRTLEQARADLAKAGLAVGAVTQVESTAPAGAVVRQTPAAGQSVPRGDAVALVLARPPEAKPPAPPAPPTPVPPPAPSPKPPAQVAVRDVRGLTLERATDALSKQGLAVGSVQTRETRDAVANAVLESRPAAGQRVAPGTKVDLVIARAPQTPEPTPAPEVRVGALKGLTLDQARDAIARQGLKVGELRYRDTDTAAPDTVIDQKPAAGQGATAGATVDLLIARAPAASGTLPGAASTWRYRFTSGWATIPPRVIVHRVLDVSPTRIRESIAAEGGGAADVKTFDRGAVIVTRVVDTLTLEEFSPFLQSFGELDAGWRRTGIPPPRDAAFASGWTISARARAEETVTVPAGSFKAMRVDVSGTLLGAPRTAAQQVTQFEHRIWYSPRVKRVVKYERTSFDQSGTPMDRDRYELLDFQLR